MAEKTAFKGAISSIGSALVDFSQLNVRTFVGTVEIKVDGEADPDWDKMMDNAVTKGTLNMAACTTIKLDGDCDYFEDPSHITADLRLAHESAVGAGHEARKGIFDLIKGSIKKLIEAT